MSRCASCNAEVIWARTAAGKMMPVDASLNPNGTMVLTLHNGERVVRAQNADDPAGPRHTSHFATCPNSASHRRSR